MHDYNTILGVIELRLSKVSYDAVQKRYRIGRSGIALIMNRYNDSGLSLDDLRQMPPAKVVDLIYPKENLRHKDIPLPDFEKIHEQMIQMGKHADLSFLWIDYKKEHPNGYQLAQFYKLYGDFMVDTYGTSKTAFQNKLFKNIICPFSESYPSFGINSISDRQNHIQIINFRLSSSCASVGKAYRSLIQFS